MDVELSKKAFFSIIKWTDASMTNDYASEQCVLSELIFIDLDTSFLYPN